MINKILILVIIIFIINYLTEGVIFNNIKSCFVMCIEKFESMLNLSNNKHINLQNKILHYNTNNINKNNIDNKDDLHFFINNLISLDNEFYDFTSITNQKLLADQQIINNILAQLIKKLNSHQYTFNNVKLLDDIYYYQNLKGKIIGPFNIRADVYYKKILNGSVIINLEMFLKENNLNNSELIITNINLIERIYPNTISKTNMNSHNYNKAIKKNKNMVKKMTDSFNNHFVNRDVYDDLFIKPSIQHTTEGFMNDTENSLIPTIVELSSYEPSSETQSSN